MNIKVVNAQNNFMDYEKIYVDVTAEFSRKGGMRPKIIVWGDGQKFEIDNVKEICRAPCKSGGVLPKRYTVTVWGKQKYLYFEREKERWFVEREIK